MRIRTRLALALVLTIAVTNGCDDSSDEDHAAVTGAGLVGITAAGERCLDALTENAADAFTICQSSGVCADVAGGDEFREACLLEIGSDLENNQQLCLSALTNGDADAQSVCQAAAVCVDISDDGDSFRDRCFVELGLATEDYQDRCVEAITSNDPNAATICQQGFLCLDIPGQGNEEFEQACLIEISTTNIERQEACLSGITSGLNNAAVICQSEGLCLDLTDEGPEFEDQCALAIAANLDENRNACLNALTTNAENAAEICQEALLCLDIDDDEPFSVFRDQCVIAIGLLP